MSLPYLPLFIDDYEAATAHLSLLEDGAYNRLLRLCWRSPGCKLPNDEAWIMRKMRAVTDAEQAAVRSVLNEFFTTGRGKIWSKRLLEVHLQKSVAHSNKVEAGKKGAAAKALKKKESIPSTAKAELKQPEPEPEPEPREDIGGGGSAGAREDRNADQPPEDRGHGQTDREQLLEAMGVGPDGIAGPSRFLGTQGDMAEARRWLALPGLTVPVVCEEIRRIITAKSDGPPSSFKYFTPAMQRLSGAISAEALAPEVQPHQARASPPRKLWNLNPDDFNPDGSLRQ